MSTILKKSINENKSFSELRAQIVNFKDSGGSQNEAQRILEELRNDFKGGWDGKIEHRILDLLDHVTGWCQEKYRIWDKINLR